MAFLIYMLSNRVSGKRYIGFTTLAIADRIKWHVRGSRRFDYPLSRAIRKHGIEAFDAVILYEATSHREAMAVERGLIAQYGTLAAGGNGYNVTAGGEGRYGARWTAEQKKAIGDRKRGSKFSEQALINTRAGQEMFRLREPEKYIEIRASAMRGRSRTDDDKEKKRLANRAYAQTPEGKADYARRAAKMRGRVKANPEMAGA